MGIANAFSDVEKKIRRGLVGKVLTIHLESVAKDARRNAPTKRIADNIVVQPIEYEDNKVVGRISISLNPESGAPEARAFELGSGIHATGDGVNPKTEFAPGGEYYIRAKNRPKLVFFWEREKRLFVGDFVTHPGVAPKPYLRPAVEAKAPNLVQSLSDALLSQFIASIRTTIRSK
jgi:hypothetical protein